MAILEPSTGGVIFKAIQRFAGTVLGGAAGVGAMYFTYLCNGLTYDNHPQKAGIAPPPWPKYPSRYQPLRNVLTRAACC